MPFKRSSLSLAIISITLISTSFAQQAIAADDVFLPTITAHSDQTQNQSSEASKSYTVKKNASATKLNISTKETPQTVNVVTRQQMDDFNLTTTRDILSNTPGVTVTGLETNRTTYTARGFDISNILVDGVGVPTVDSYNYNNSDNDGYFYDRIEVIKGADALTNSLGDPGATINYVRKKPTQTFQANAAISYGSWDTQRYEANIAGPLTQDGRVRGRITAYEKAGDSYLDKYSEEKNGVQAILEADLTDTTLASIGYSHTNQLTNGAQWGALPLVNQGGQQLSYARSYNYAPSWTYYDWTIDNYFATIEQKLGDNWTAKLHYNDTRSDLTNKMLYLSGAPSATDSTSGIYLYPNIYNQKFAKQTADANISGSFPLFGQQHEVSFGYTWSKSTTRSTYAGAYIGYTTDLASWSPAEPTWNSMTVVPTEQYTIRSLYGSARIHLNDDLKVILGANYSEIDFKDTYKKNKTSPYAGITYNFNPTYTGYVSYTSIFRPQTVIDLATKQVAVPVEGESYETGVKGTWLNDRITGSLSIFRTEQSNFALNPIFIGNGYYSYLGTVRSQGVELGLTGKVTDDLDLIFGYTKFSLKDTSNGINPRQYNPTQTFNVLATYRVPQWPKLKIGASVRWQDDIADPSTSNGYGLIQQDAYALFGLMASYDINKYVSVQVNGNNLTNEKYLTGLNGGQGYYGAPANYSVAFRFKY